MADPANPGGNGAGDDKELPKEDNIRVVCRFRPLNDSEERTGSKFVVKFPDDQCASITVQRNEIGDRLVCNFDYYFFPGKSVHV